MNILHIITSFDPSTGGPARIALRLAAGTAALGHNVTVLSYTASPQAQQAIALMKMEQVRGNYMIAKYYEKTHRQAVAVVYYNEV